MLNLNEVKELLVKNCQFGENVVLSSKGAKEVLGISQQELKELVKIGILRKREFVGSWYSL